MAGSGYVAARVYMKPLLPPGGIRSFNVDKVLRRAQRDLLKRLRTRLVNEPFSDRAKKALTRAIKIRISPSSLTVWSDHPGFKPLVEGQRKGQMTWLSKARVPIPIMLETGKLIFRNASPQSMANGKWVHPGREPSDFVAKAKAESRTFLKKKLTSELQKYVMERFATAMRSRGR